MKEEPETNSVCEEKKEVFTNIEAEEVKAEKIVEEEKKAGFEEIKVEEPMRRTITFKKNGMKIRIPTPLKLSTEQKLPILKQSRPTSP